MEVDSCAKESAMEVQRLIENLSHYISATNYGADIEHFTIGLICIKTKPGYENWYKQRKPRFNTIEKVKLLNGTVMEINNTFTYDIKLTDEEIDQFNSSGQDAVNIFSKKLIESLSNFKSPSMMKRDLNLSLFEEDITRFISNEKHV